MSKMKKMIEFYGNYFIADYPKKAFLMVDTANWKIRAIDEDCFFIIQELNSLKEDLNELM